jgi:cyclin-dependent kinase regulatory subunit CKS1
MTADMEIDFTRRNKKPRPLSEHEKEKLDEFVDAIHYSARYVVDSDAIDVSEADEGF